MSASDYNMAWLSSLRSLMATVKNNLSKEQERYKRDLDQRVQLTGKKVNIGSKV